MHVSAVTVVQLPACMLQLQAAQAGIMLQGGLVSKERTQLDVTLWLAMYRGPTICVDPEHQAQRSPFCQPISKQQQQACGGQPTVLAQQV
jgi:hypothetical protein